MVTQVFELKPRHDLEKITVEGTRNAARVESTSLTRRVQMVHIHACSHDEAKLVKRVAPFRQSSSVGSQIAGDDVRGARYQRAEIPPSAQVRRRIDPFWLAKEWVSAREELVVSRASVVTIIAKAYPVYQVAAQAHQRSVPPGEIQRDGRDVKPALNS